ncbi:MAG: Maf family protein [Planctomycetales bacterium]
MPAILAKAGPGTQIFRIMQRLAEIDTVVLGSRSPRRRELLALLVPEERIVVVPPRSAEEPGFDELDDRGAILARLRDIARAKCDDALAQWRAEGFSPPALRGADDVHPPKATGRLTPAAGPVIVAADTIILAEDAAGRPVVLGQPPENDAGDTVRRWFRDHLFGRTHEAITALCLAVPDANVPDASSRHSSLVTRHFSMRERTVSTRVAFRDRDDELLEWYIATGEPFGKAGAYGIQGAGSLFATRIEGSLSNVVGLPLEALREMLEESALSPT